MKRILTPLWMLLLLFTAGGSTVSAQQARQPFEVDLWPKGMPNTNELDKMPFDESKGNYKPRIRVYLPAPELATGRAVVVCPGGGYTWIAYDHEGYDWAPYFNKQGIAIMVLTYRMPNGGHREVPLSDAEEALKMVRDSADVWGINPFDVGIMGSSAGGHLATTVATHARPEVKPNFQILFYPVVSMDKSITHMGSHDFLLGADATPELEAQYSNEKRVTADTPPAFIAHSDDDGAVIPQNSVDYYLALNKAGVPSVLHIYPSGGHGWGIKEGFLYKNRMLDELTEWLQSVKAPRIKTSRNN